MAYYKVLDVREKESTYSYTDYTTTNTATHTVFVILAEDPEGKRKRFHMYDGFKSLYMGKWSYYGYEGDFDLLVKGDWFQIKQTSTWPVVTVLGVSEEED